MQWLHTVAGIHRYWWRERQVETAQQDPVQPIRGDKRAMIFGPKFLRRTIPLTGVALEVDSFPVKPIQLCPARVLFQVEFNFIGVNPEYLPVAGPEIDSANASTVDPTPEYAVIDSENF